MAPDCWSVCRCPPDGATGNRTLEGTLGLYIKEAGWSIDSHQSYIFFDMAKKKNVYFNFKFEHFPVN